MKIIVFLFAIYIGIIPTYSGTRYITTTGPAQEYSNEAYSYGLNKIAEIEKNIYGQAFNGQNIVSRIERLEMDVFNRTYPNSSVDQRINNLIYTYKHNTQVVDSHADKTGKIKNILNGLGSAFLGVPTGYTPPIYTDPYSTPYYSIGSNGIGQHYGQYGDYYGNNGWHRQHHGYGSGTGIHILD